MNINIENKIKKLPKLPGVYFFKTKENQIIYIGKAKNLKNRVSSYLKNQDWKSKSIIQASSTVEYIVTKTEFEAMILEAKLIQNNQPKFNILLKTGQPFLYIIITKTELPEIKLVRNKKIKGTYFGPFLEKQHTRKVYNFLIKTFRLKICKKKIKQGCLYYHMGICAGTCKSDFKKKDYLKRLELAKKSLQFGHQKFLRHLQEEINQHNKKLEFEKSKDLNEYYKAFESVFGSITIKIEKSGFKDLFSRDIWILHKKQNLFLYKEKNGTLRKKENFFLLKNLETFNEQTALEYIYSYYQTRNCPTTILINFKIDSEQKKLLEQFLKKWHSKENNINIVLPKNGHLLNLLKLAQIKTEQQIKKQKTLGLSLKTFLKLDFQPQTIDCFDISHKQGFFITGACIRFKNGKPDKKNFRKFKIKTVRKVDDYAALQEIVKRRYKDPKNLPDLILIDGGKGQLNAIKNLFPMTECASLAKREETIFSSRLPNGKKLNIKTFVGQVLIALRDYTHHFAISYHRKLEKLIF